MEPDQGVCAHLQKNPQQRPPVAFGFLLVWGLSAKQKNGSEGYPAQHHSGKGDERNWIRLIHKR
jgi:hypothetical protein